MRAVQRSPFGHPVPNAHGYGYVQPGYGAAVSAEEQQIQVLIQQGYSRDEANEILGLAVGAGKVTRSPSAADIIGGILDVGGQVVETFSKAQQAARSNVGLGPQAGNLAAQQAALDARRGTGVTPAMAQSNGLLYLVLGVGGLAAVGFLVYAVTRK